MEDEGSTGGDEGAGPRTWELEDGARRPVRRARTGRWEKTLHGVCEQWARLPSALPDERRTPFAAESALERVCGLAPLRGTRWPQETARAFARREPQYAGDLAAAAGASHGRTVGECVPLARHTAEATACADSAEDESDTSTSTSSSSSSRVSRMPEHTRVRAVDAAEVRVARGGGVGQEEEDEEECKHVHKQAVEPEVLGCARHVLAEEGLRVRDVGRDGVRAACTAVQEILDAVHDRLLDRALGLRSSSAVRRHCASEGGHEEEGEEDEDEDEDEDALPLGAADVFEAAAEVLLARRDVPYPASALEEARGAAGHVESVLESLQTADIAAALRELRDDPCAQQPPPTSADTRYNTASTCTSSTSEGVGVCTWPTLARKETAAACGPDRRLTATATLRARRRLLRDMPARLRPWVDSHVWFARLRVDEVPRDVWALVREWQDVDARLEERRIAMRSAEQRAKRARTSGDGPDGGPGGPPDDTGDVSAPASVPSDSDGSTTDESPPHTLFPTMT